MRQRGRKPTGTVLSLAAAGDASRLNAPVWLSSEERALFIELVEACSAEHFRTCDLPLLTSFVTASIVARHAASDPDQIAVWEKSVKLQAVLATRLRLSPQSRVDPKTIGRKPELRGPMPWETTE